MYLQKPKPKQLNYICRLQLTSLRPKIFSIIFLFFLVAPVTTVYLVLRNQQKQVRREVKWKMIAGIDKSELVLLTFKQAEIKNKLSWKHDREFQFKGEFYDIVQKEVHGDSVSYWCWWDNEETHLSQKLEHIMANHWNQNPTHKQKKEGIQKLLKSLFIDSISERTPVLVAQVGCEVWNYIESFQTPCFSPQVPPPRCI